MRIRPNPATFAGPRGPQVPCPECGKHRWIQRLAIWHERDGYWSAQRACRACEHRWTDTWVDREPGPVTGS